MKVTDSEFLKNFTATCESSYQKGWNEANGGNMSYRIPIEEINDVWDDFNLDRPWTSIGVTVSNLAGEYFLVTGSGKYFKNTQKAPAENVCLIEINDTGTMYRIVWGLKNGGRPTSELPTHLLGHSVKLATGSENRVILHNHPVHLIALTFVLPLNDRDFTRELWDMMPECPVVIPRGIGVLEFMLTGSIDIAIASAEKLRLYDAVVWAGHGIFCSAKTFDSAFGMVDTIEKASTALSLVLSMGGKKWRPSREQTMLLKSEYGFDVNESFFD